MRSAVHRAAALNVERAVTTLMSGIHPMERNLTGGQNGADKLVSLGPDEVSPCGCDRLVASLKVDEEARAPGEEGLHVFMLTRNFSHSLRFGFNKA